MGRTVILLKVDHAMNLSGIGLNAAWSLIHPGVKFNKEEVAQELLILYDDVSLPMVSVLVPFHQSIDERVSGRDQFFSFRKPCRPQWTSEPV